MSSYYKRYWKEKDSEGIMFFYETDDSGYPTRQIEVWDNGQISKYDEQNLEDDTGFLADQPLDVDEFKKYEITKEEFDTKWLKK